MKKILLATSTAMLFTVSTGVQALGSNEERVLQALGGLYVIDRIVDHSVDRRINDSRVIRDHSHITRDPSQGYQSAPIRSSHGVRRAMPIDRSVDQAYRQGVLDRQRELLNQSRERAYRCGYSGDC